MSRPVRALPWLWLLLTAQAGAAPQWIDHASNPGPDAAEIGQSRFDHLFGRQGGYQVPYPFTELIDFLEARIDNGEHRGVRRVFVPRGRSLQRGASSPDDFKFPRQIIALEGEPVSVGMDAGRVLEYRLFIAHQPNTETLEVISYNDAAGRFEFQMVEDYAAGKRARVRRANRVMCLSCHQNAAPIFAQTPWSETSFNPAVAKQLVVHQPQRYDSFVGVVTEDAGFIDVLTERANYLSTAQTIWRRGCSSRRCRAAILRAILQYRLSGESSFDWRRHGFRDHYFAELERNWETLWPQGLALAGSRINDRDPFNRETPLPDQDPLFARPAHATWYRVDSVLARGIVYRLAGFLTLDDIRRLDRYLAEQGRNQARLWRRHRSKCIDESHASAPTILLCGNPAAPDTLRARIEIDGQAGIEALRFLSLQLPGDPNIWQPRVGRLGHFSGRVEIEPGLDADGLLPRLSNGDRIAALTILSDDTGWSLDARIAVEFDPLDRAIDRMMANQTDALSDKPFRRDAIVSELMQQLGMTALRWQPTRQPSPDNPAQSGARLSGGLALLDPYCAHCHGFATSHPPGFLFGDGAAERVRQCAPRILIRLEAWQSESAFSPMPPPASLGFSGAGTDTWPLSDHYNGLVDALTALVPGEFRGLAYDDLPPCLSRN